ncbi:MAG TPA: hypothetical protein VF476_10860 [Chitinophagaceae bacterium]
MAKNSKDISAKMGEIVQKNKNKYKGDGHKKIAEANDVYNKLVSQGLVEKRGYTLRGIEDVHLLHIRPN